MNQVREKYLQSLKGDLAGFIALMGAQFGAKVDMLAQLLGDAHHPSLGAYKERILADAIAASLPKRYSVGTGFVLFPYLRPVTEKKGDKMPKPALIDHRPSSQCDLIVYDSSSYPTIFQDSQFVVVRPEAVHAIIEVKGSLDPKALKTAVDSLIRFGREWVACDRLYADQLWKTRLHCPGLFIMAWQTGISPTGKPRINGTQVREYLAREYKRAVRRDELEKFPMLHSAYVYNDYIVSQVAEIKGNAEKADASHGYATTRGKSKRITSAGTAETVGDMTVGALIAALQLFLTVRFNSLFSYFDQGEALDKEHPHSGYTPWLFGDDDVAKVGRSTDSAEAE